MYPVYPKELAPGKLEKALIPKLTYSESCVYQINVSAKSFVPDFDKWSGKYLLKC